MEIDSQTTYKNAHVKQPSFEPLNPLAQVWNSPKEMEADEFPLALSIVRVVMLGTAGSIIKTNQHRT
jgi:hypothetical protein